MASDYGHQISFLSVIAMTFSPGRQWSRLGGKCYNALSASDLGLNIHVECVVEIYSDVSKVWSSLVRPLWHQSAKVCRGGVPRRRARCGRFWTTFRRYKVLKLSGGVATHPQTVQQSEMTSSGPYMPKASCSCAKASSQSNDKLRQLSLLLLRVWAYAYIYMYICIHVHIYTCTYIDMYIYRHVHI